MQWIEISIVCRHELADQVMDLLGDFTPNGIIQEAYEQSPDHTKLTIYGDVSETEEDWIKEVEAILNANLSPEAFEGLDSISAKTVDANDWLHSWQQYIEPTEILPGIIIKPEWQDYEAKPGERVLEIASDLSFGTGAHETTRNCAKLAASYLQEEGIIDETYNLLDTDRAGALMCLDIGTGTGILVLVAHALGLRNLCGIDIESSAVKDAENNAKKNKVTASFICGDLDRDYHDQANLIFANLTVDPLKMLLPVIGKKLAPKGKLIISGIIDDRYQEIMPYIEADWSIDREVIDGPWHTFMLSAK